MVAAPLILLAAPASAWKVSTHQMTAVRAAQDLPAGDLRTLLLANERHLRAGAMGPDIFYLPPSTSYNFFSNLAHYCKTDELATTLLDLAQSRGPEAKAFAYGWFSHNVADSVAHPWVNGFTSQPYADAKPTRPELTAPPPRANKLANTTGTGLHVATWDGANWIEREVRQSTTHLETYAFDLAGAFPAGATEYRVRLTQDGGTPARLDYGALSSGGALVLTHV